MVNAIRGVENTSLETGEVSERILASLEDTRPSPGSQQWVLGESGAGLSLRHTKTGQTFIETAGCDNACPVV